MPMYDFSVNCADPIPYRSNRTQINCSSFLPIPLRSKTWDQSAIVIGLLLMPANKVHEVKTIVVGHQPLLKTWRRL